MSSEETKEKILSSAIDLFAEKGFEGASIRDIAHKADVNLAAINYHYQNKSVLFRETVKSCYLEASREIQSLAVEGISVEDFAINLYEYFLENAEIMRIHFKSLLSDGVLVPDEIGTDDDQFGPPGSQFLATVIKGACTNISDKDLHWAVLSIYMHISHLLVIGTSAISQRKAAKKLLDFKVASAGIRKLCRAIMKEIQG